MAGDRDVELSILMQLVRGRRRGRRDRGDLPSAWVSPPTSSRTARTSAMARSTRCATSSTRLRDEAGISYVTVREMDAFAPVVARLA